MSELANFAVFKDANQPGRWRWIGVYTNSLADDDWPPDILTSDAQLLAADRFSKGEVPLPPLYLWHEPAWKIGETDMVVADVVESDVVFLIATGLIDEDKDEVVPYLQNEFNQMSHGLYAFKYTTTVDYDNALRYVDDYLTVEISALPGSVSRPANPFTYFQLMEEPDMAVDQEKRDMLARILPEGVIAALERGNKAIAERATAGGVQRKDADAEVDTAETETVDAAETEVEAVVEAVVKDEAEEEENEEETGAEKDVDTAPDAETQAVLDIEQTVELLSDMIAERFLPDFAKAAAEHVAALSARVDALTDEVKEMKAQNAQLKGQLRDEVRAVKELVSPNAVGAFSTALLQSMTKAADDIPTGDKATEPAQAAGQTFFEKLLGGN